jgi:hypothetical protein
MPKLTRIEIRNFLGLEHLAFDVPAAGAIIAGANRVGKTSVLKAISAALAAQGVGPEAIRSGADKAEILVDLDAVGRVRKAITAKGDSVSVTTPAGDRWARPQSRLDELLGTAALDPLDFFLSKPAERKAKVLAAIPMEVTAEDLLRWTGDNWQPEAGRHGLEVLDEVGRHYYEQRREANKAAADLAVRYADATAKAKALQSDAHVGVSVPPAGEEDQPVRAAEQARAALTQRQHQAEDHKIRTAGTRGRIADLRAEVLAMEEAQGDPPTQAEWADICIAFDNKKAEVDALKAKLAAAEAELAPLRERAIGWNRRTEAYSAAQAPIEAKERTANELEATLAESAIVPPGPDEFAAAAEAVKTAEGQRDLIRAARAAHDALAAAAAIGDELAIAKAKAESLDAIVTRLKTEAPLELTARASSIPGLAVSGDGITLDGKALDNLSGAEAMEFAVALAKRLNRGSKLLRVDKLEQLDPDTLEKFVAMATADDWQLIGSRVERGELAIYAIEAGKPRVRIELEAEKSAGTSWHAGS